jgi:hypothetical protein
MEDLKRIINRKLNHAKKRLEQCNKIPEDILTKHGAWSTGYWKGIESCLEDLLDEINEKSIDKSQ